jgi:hypothetical protein
VGGVLAQHAAVAMVGALPRYHSCTRPW